MSSRNMQWPDALVEKAKPLYESGRYSCAEVGRMVGKSRGAIIGKANRDGWINPNPQQGGTRAGEKRPRISRKFDPRSRIVESLMEQSSAPEDPLPFLNLTFVDLIDNGPHFTQCRYPHGGDVLGQPIFYCGQPTANDSPWCFHHFEVCCPGLSRRGSMNLPPMNGIK